MTMTSNMSLHRGGRTPESEMESSPQARKSAAFKTVVAELQTARDEVERFKEKSKHLELAVTRTDAWLARTRRSLATERSENARLRSQLPPQESAAEVSGLTCPDAEPASRVSAVTPNTHPLKTEKDVQEQTSVSGQSETMRTDTALSGAVSFEAHELLIREVGRLRGQLSLLAMEKGRDVDTILEAVEYKEMIEKLQEDIQDRVDENMWLVERMRELCETDNVPASQMVQLKFQNEKLTKRLLMSQRVIDTLSKRYEELKDEVEVAGGQRSERWPDQSRPKIKGEFRVRVGHAIPSEESVDIGSFNQCSEEQVESFETEDQLPDKIKVLIASNQQLQRDRLEAERQREVFEQRYNSLMETLQDVQQSQRQCSNCRQLEQELSKARQETAGLRDMNELVTAQMKLNGEELMQERQELVSQKQKNSFHMEQWKKNCQLMSQQVDLLMGDLRKEREETQRLRAQLKGNRVWPPSRPTVSMAPTFTNTDGGRSSSSLLAATPKPRCGSTSAPPFARQFWLDEIECDGPGGHDEPDGYVAEPTPSSSSSPPLPGVAGHGGNAATPPRSEGEAERVDCPCCERTFRADRREEFEVHVNKCLDNS